MGSERKRLFLQLVHKSFEGKGWFNLDSRTPRLFWAQTMAINIIGTQCGVRDKGFGGVFRMDFVSLPTKL
jgi:hypothetical protein